MDSNFLAPTLTPERLAIVGKIESYGARYDPDSGLSLEDQLLACEAIAESVPVIEHNETTSSQPTDKSVFSGNGSVNGACYLEVNSKLVANCERAIEQLNSYSSRSAPIEVAAALEQSLGKARTDLYWLRITKRFNPRQLRWMLKRVMKQASRGEIIINNFYGYFFSLQKFRKPKKSVRKREKKA